MVGMLVIIYLLLEAYCTFFRPVYISPEDYFDNFTVADDELGYKLANNFKGLYKQDYELIYTTNSYGLRDRDFSLYPNKDTLRILAIGDSWTFGPGVDLIYTWPKQLENILKKRGINAEVVNSGVDGYSTIIYYRVLKKFYGIYHPDAVIVITCGNDPGGDLADLEKIYPVLTSKDNFFKKWLKKNSHLAKNLWFIYQRYFPRKYGFRYIDKVVEKAKDDKELNFALQLYSDSLLEMKKFCDKNDIFFAVATLCTYPLEFHEYTKAVCEAKNIKYISLQSLNNRDLIKEIALNTSAGHFNSKGYFMLAGIITDSILKDIDSMSRGKIIRK